MIPSRVLRVSDERSRAERDIVHDRRHHVGDGIEIGDLGAHKAIIVGVEGAGRIADGDVVILEVVVPNVDVERVAVPRRDRGAGVIETIARDQLFSNSIASPLPKLRAPAVKS